LLNRNKILSDLGIGRSGPIQWPPRSPDVTPLDVCLWGWMKGEVYKRQVITQDQLFARILDPASRIKRHEVQIRRTARDLHARVAKWTEVGGGILEHLLWVVTNLSFTSNQFFI
jgi:hypothetical protein